MRFVWSRGVLGLSLGIVAWTAAAGTAPPPSAVWREWHVDMQYAGRAARYSCDGLRDKLRALLLNLGARRDLQIVAGGCSPYGRPADAAAGLRLDIRFSALALPQPGLRPRHAGDLAAATASFAPFSIAGDVFRNLGVGDCELVQQFTRRLLPLFVTRGVRKDIACGAHAPGGAHFLVMGEALRGASPVGGGESTPAQSSPGR